MTIASLFRSLYRRRTNKRKHQTIPRCNAVELLESRIVLATIGGIATYGPHSSPIAHAQIHVVSEDSTIDSTVSTDGNGRYAVPFDPTGQAVDDVVVTFYYRRITADGSVAFEMNGGQHGEGATRQQSLPAFDIPANLNANAHIQRNIHLVSPPELSPSYGSVYDTLDLHYKFFTERLDVQLSTIAVSYPTTQTLNDDGQEVSLRVHGDGFVSRYLPRCETRSAGRGFLSCRAVSTRLS